MTGEFFPAAMQPYAVAEYLRSNLISGLNQNQVKKRRSKFGANNLKQEYRLSFSQSMKKQILGLTAVLLILGCLIIYAFDRQPIYLLTAGLIFVIILFNSLLESKATGAFNIPKEYTTMSATVTRESVTDSVDSRRLVPGDIIYLKEGMVVPCDARLIEDKVIAVLETPFTGSPTAVLKDSLFLAEEGEEALIWPNMLYAGSIVTGGEATAIVCYTGEDTLIRRLNESNKERLPGLLKYIKSFCGYVSVLAVTFTFILLFSGIVAGRDLYEIFPVALATGALSLCESITALTAAAFGFGSKSMINKGAVVKNPNCIPTLCRTDSIMATKSIAFPPRVMNLTGVYVETSFQSADKKLSDRARELLYLSLACSDLKIVKNQKRKQSTAGYEGELYDMALAEYLSEKGYNVADKVEEYVKIQTDRTLSGQVNRVLVLYKGRNLVILKGSPESVLSRCSGYELNGTGYKLSPVTKKRILSAIQEQAHKSSYIIAIAAGETMADNLRDITAERRLMFKGFISLFASLDVNISSSVYRLNQAGIETVVSCYDSYYTAYNTAKNAGIISGEDQVITAEGMRACDPGLFIADCPNYKLFLNLEDREWREVLSYRKEDKKTVGVTAETTQDLQLMKQGDISFVPDHAPDTLKQSADILVLRGGLDTLTESIKTARQIFTRVHGVAEYLTVGLMTVFLSSLLALLFGMELPFRLQEIFFGGIIFNLLFAFSLAMLPQSRKLLLEQLPHYKPGPTFADFVKPLVYSLGVTLCVLLIFVVTGASRGALLVGFTFLLFLYALSDITRGSVFLKKSVFNPLLTLFFFLSLGIMGGLFYFSPLSSFFGYDNTDIYKVGIALGISAVYYLILHITKLFIKTKQNPATKAKEIFDKVKNKI